MGQDCRRNRSNRDTAYPVIYHGVPFVGVDMVKKRYIVMYQIYTGEAFADEVLCDKVTVNNYWVKFYSDKKLIRSYNKEVIVSVTHDGEEKVAQLKLVEGDERDGGAN